MSAYLADWLPLIQSLGWTLLHFLWQGALVGAGYALVRTIVPASHAEARYAAGLTALALIALAPVATLAVLYPHFVAAASAGASTVLDTGIAAVTAAVSPEAEYSLDRLLPWLVLLWGVGVAVMAWRALRQWQALEHIARRCARTSSELERMLASLSKRFNLVRSIRVLVSDHIDTPTLIGWIKPVILIPTAVALGFPRHQVELILAHELGHLRRYDHLVNLAQAVIETLLFYHPVVHWISREVRNDREVCCDRLVLRLTRGEPREYAQTLASLEELRLASPQLAIAASGGVLLDRVRRIIDMPTPRLAAAPRPTLGLTVLVAAAVMIAGISVLRPDRKDLDALAAGANALLERLPRPDAAFLVGFALREPPKWTVSMARPKLAKVAPPPEIAPPVAPQVKSIAVDAVPPPVSERAALTTNGLGPVANLDTLPRPSTPPADTVLPTVSSEAQAPARPATASVTARARHLVAVHVIQPRYPDYRAVKEPVRVDVQFSLNADGTVRDVAAVVDSEDNRAFGASAEKAMRMWRFDPASVPADASARFQQSFVFAKQSDIRHRAKPSDGEAFDCVRRTGSLVCRHPEEEEVALPLTIIEANANGPMYP
ncbi:MAG TPA: TonB family protein [Rhodanobacteraceae bacterium]|nr:TonB family protein [Rhodanobacteraceae bacterium]